MAGYSGLDFGSVHDEVTYWLNNTSSLFKGGWSGSGENGNDFSMPTGTPVYAITSGQVVGAGYYGGGGVVSVQQYPGRVWYYQHLDQNALLPPGPGHPGQFVNAGDLIGYSGGQNVGGNHPSQLFFSTYPHIEVGIDAPWGGIWGGGPNVGPNIDPRPTIQQVQVATATGNVVPTGGTNTMTLPPIMQPSTTSGGGFLGLSATQDTGQQSNCVQPTGVSALDPTAWANFIACRNSMLAATGNPFSGLGAAVGGGILSAFDATGIGKIALFFSNPLRLFKGLTGAFLIVASVLVLILPDIGAVATAALGFPEAAPAVYEGLKHPTGMRPHQIVTQTYTFRQQQKQSALRQARYNEQVRRYMERQDRQARASQASQAAGAQEQQIQRKREEIGQQEAPRREEIARRTVPPPGNKPTTPTPATPAPPKISMTSEQLAKIQKLAMDAPRWHANFLRRQQRQANKPKPPRLQQSLDEIDELQAQAAKPEMPKEERARNISRKIANEQKKPNPDTNYIAVLEKALRNLEG